MSSLPIPTAQPLSDAVARVRDALSKSVSFLLTGVPPPSTLYVGPDDQLWALWATSNGSDTITVSGRLLRPDGTIVPFQVSDTNALGNRSLRIVKIPLAEGYLLSVLVSSTGSNQRGRTFVRVGLFRGSISTTSFLNAAAILLADYVTKQSPLGYPGGRIIHPTEGPGWYNSAFITNPAAGAEFNVAQPSNTQWRLVQIVAGLTTSAVVANRQVDLRDVAGNSFGNTGAPAAQAASITVRYAWSIDVAQYTTARGVVVIPLLSNARRTQGVAIGSSTTNIDAADQWFVNTSVVEDWLDF